jgi:putative membrane protein
MMYGRNGFSGYGCSHFYGGGYHMGFMILGILLIVFLIYKFTKKKYSHSNEIIEVLKMKYISGEINEEEYLQRKNVLKK